MKNILSIFLLLFTLALSSCAGGRVINQGYSEKLNVDLSVDNNNSSIERGEHPILSYQASRTLLFDLIHTELHVAFNWVESQVLGSANITLSPHFYPQDKLVLDAKGMEIHSIHLENQALKYQYDGNQLFIELDKTYRKSDTIVVRVKYTAFPDKQTEQGSDAITMKKGLYFINPKGDVPGVMPQIWTQGETESNSVWFPTIDAPNQKMSQDIFITVDSKYTTLSNGLLIDSQLHKDGSRTDHWKQTLSHAPYLTMLGVGEFAVVKDSWTRRNGETVEVHYYVEPEWAPYAKSIFGNTPEMLSFFSNLLGYEYPWDKYHQIVVRDFVSGAMENTGAVVFSDMVYGNERDALDQSWESIVAHELFHHWFGDLVTCESWSNLPLNESFANYSQYLWDEYKHGADEADYQAHIEAQGYFNSAKNSGHHDLIWFDYADKEQMFDGHSYNKGGRVLHMLRNYLGDEAFFESIKHYLHKNEFTTAEAHDLRLAFEEVSGEDLNWFFNQWFFDKGHPIIDVSYSRSKDSLLVSLKQIQSPEEFPLFAFPLSVTIMDNSGRRKEPVFINSREQTFSLFVKDSLMGFILDTDHVLLADWRNNQPLYQLVWQFYNGDKFADRSLSFKEIVSTANPWRAQVILDALNDKHHSIRSTAIKQCNRLKTTHKSQIIDLLHGIALSDSMAQVRQEALMFLAQHFSDEPSVYPLAKKLLASDLSYKVVGYALFVVALKDLDFAKQKAKTLQHERSATMMVYLAYFYATYGSAVNQTFYASILADNLLNGFSWVEALGAYNSFLENQDIQVHETAYDVFLTLYKIKSGDDLFYVHNALDKFITHLNTVRRDLVVFVAENQRNKDSERFLIAQNQLKRTNALIAQLSSLR